jgi:hypothetical protein
MGSIEGVLIAESLKVGVELSGTPLVVDRIVRVDAADATADQPRTWTLLYFRAEQTQAEALAGKLADLLDTPGWYVDFRTEEEVYVTFPDKIFRYTRGDAAGRAEAVAYGRTVGVPDSQLDWAG